MGWTDWTQTVPLFEDRAPSPFDAILKGLEEAIQTRLPKAHITTTSLMGIWQVGVLYVTSHELFTFQSGQIFIQLTADGFLVDRRNKKEDGILVAYEDPDAIEKVLQLVVAITEPQRKVRRPSKTELSSPITYSPKSSTVNDSDVHHNGFYSDDPKNHPDSPYL